MKTYSVSIKTVLNEPNEKEWEILCEDLPKKIVKKAVRFKNWRDKAIRLHGWKMLLRELKKINQTELMNTIKFEKKGKPFFDNSNIFFNMSNSKNTIILITAPYEVGVDLEFVRPVKRTIYSRVFCKEEIEFLGQSNNEEADFIKLWTKKEAVVKLFGGGISMGLANFSVLKNELFVFGRIVIIEKIDFMEGSAHLAFFKH
jgi:phosphopantetheinyl transferase